MINLCLKELRTSTFFWEACEREKEEKTEKAPNDSSFKK
jgi:hypothetical protein